jgi:hypothetical protein
MAVSIVTSSLGGTVFKAAGETLQLSRFIPSLALATGVSLGCALGAILEIRNLSKESYLKSDIMQRTEMAAIPLIIIGALAFIGPAFPHPLWIMAGVFSAPAFPLLSPIKEIMSRLTDFDKDVRKRMESTVRRAFIALVAAAASSSLLFIAVGLSGSPLANHPFRAAAGVSIVLVYVAANVSGLVRDIFTSRAAGE